VIGSYSFTGALMPVMDGHTGALMSTPWRAG
jgi:hypothetical protein